MLRKLAWGTGSAAWQMQKVTDRRWSSLPFDAEQIPGFLCDFVGLLRLPPKKAADAPLVAGVRGISTDAFIVDSGSCNFARNPHS